MHINLGFWGTPSISASLLTALINDPRYNVVFAVTKEDKPRSKRGRTILPSHVKQLCQETQIPCLSPTSLQDKEFQSQLAQYAVTFNIVVAYGKMIPSVCFNMPTHGTFNFHASLLPLLRGASPIECVLLHGHLTTGWTLQKINETIDTGNIFHQSRIDIEWTDEQASLWHKLEINLIQHGLDVLDKLYSGLLGETKQEEGQTSYCHKIYTQSGQISWDKDIISIRNLCRAFNKKPGSFTSWKGLRIRIFCDFNVPEKELYSSKVNQPSGSISIDSTHILKVVCGDQYLLPISHIQLPGKKKITGKDFINGYLQNKSAIFS